MEKKKFGYNLVVIGFILFIISSCVFTFISIYWPNVSAMRLPEEIELEKKLTIIMSVTVIIFNFCSLGFLLIGGRIAVKRRDYWFLLIGLIILAINLLLGVKGFLISLLELPFYFFSAFQMLLIYYIISGIGFTFIVVGVIMKYKNRNSL
ncbi:MAG: hypothetical protein ACFE9Z_05095 [Promethearchaeota archaeon]